MLMGQFPIRRSHIERSTKVSEVQCVAPVTLTRNKGEQRDTAVF